MVIQSHRVEQTGFSGALFLWKGSQTWAQTLTTGSQRPENVWSLPLRSSPLSQDALVAVAFLLPVNWWGGFPFPPQPKNVMEHVILVTRDQGSLAAMKGIRAKASWWRCLDLVWPQWMISWGGGKFTQKVFLPPKMSRLEIEKILNGGWSIWTNTEKTEALKQVTYIKTYKLLITHDLNSCFCSFKFVFPINRLALSVHCTCLVAKQSLWSKHHREQLAFFAAF